MTSKVEIFNKALNLLGKSRVNSPTENSESSTVLNSIYDSCLDELLVSLPFNFSIARQTLTVLANETNLSAFDYIYQLPTLPYCLKILDINNSNTALFITEGRFLYSDELSVNLRYIGRVTDSQLFSPEFVKALSLLLASEAANSLTGSASMAEKLYGMYYNFLKQASTSNAIEGYNPQEIESEVINSQL